MNCQEVEERDILEEYLLDRLTEPERDEFEKHYFECGSCFSQLQTRLALQTELRRQPAMPARTRGASLRRVWAWTPAFAAVVLLIRCGNLVVFGAESPAFAAGLLVSAQG